MNPRLISSVEGLEARIAPSVTILNSHTATYVEPDGDTLTLTITHGSLGDENFRVDQIAGARLSVLLDRGTFGREFAGSDLRITVERGPGGNGLADLGAINADETSLGVVSVEGNIATLSAHHVRVLRCDSLGLAGTGFWTQLSGSLGRLEIAHDLDEAYLYITGSLGSAHIGGSFLGGRTERSGSLFVEGPVGSIAVGGGLIGGAGNFSGGIGGNGHFGSISVGGSFIGGAGFDSGMIYAPQGFDHATVRGSLVGGSGPSSGALLSDRPVLSIELGGSILGGTIGVGGRIGLLSIAGSLAGGETFASGLISAGRIHSLTIGGSVIGGDGPSSGWINLEHGADSLRIGGSLLGGDGPGSGTITLAKPSASVRIGGDLRGGGGNSSGFLELRQLGQFRLGGSLIGGAGLYSGVVQVDGTIGSARIGEVQGGSGQSSGEFVCGDLGSLTVKGDVAGGPGGYSGTISVEHRARSIHLGGDLIGGGGQSGHIVGGTYLSPTSILGQLKIDGSILGGIVQFDGSIGSLRVGHDITGEGTGFHTGNDFDGGLVGAVGSIGSVFVGGSLRSHIASFAGTLGPVRIVGDLAGSVGSGGEVTYAGLSAYGLSKIAPGSTRDVAISSIEIGGDVVFARILGGYDYELPRDADAQIGHVTVGGDWIASELLAGTEHRPGGLSGYQHIFVPGLRDAAGITSSIGAILIKGRLLASDAAPALRSVFVAQQIISFRADGHSLPLTGGTDGPFTLGTVDGLGDLIEV